MCDMLKIACLSWLIEHQIGPLNKHYGLSSLKFVMHLMSLDSPMFVLVALRNLHVRLCLFHVSDFPENTYFPEMLFSGKENIFKCLVAF